MLELDIGAADIFFNVTNSHTCLVNNTILWRGDQEKDLNLLQVFIKALTKPRDVVLDACASICDYRPQNQSFVFDYSLSIFLCVFND